MADIIEKRKYITIKEIQQEYLPISKKRIRKFVQQYLNAKYIGGRIFVDRQELEKLLSSPDRDYFPIQAS